MIEIDQLIQALFLLALLLYLVPAAFRLGEGRRWFYGGATILLAIAIAIAAAMSVIFFAR
ncbi:MAG: hypothetical protein L0Y57_02675 [Beijerinckiaceae bacterium]|nr:hypothetical protein [Beijerinckiaceae bacterium]